MKGLIKLFSAVAFVGALASCSDDLSLSKANLDPNADLYATLPTTSETTRMGVLENMHVVWSKGDMINVYSSEALKFNTYGLISGEGTSTGSFVLKGTDNGVASMPSLKAISSSQYLKGVHATADNEMQLIAKIPANFTQNEEVNDQNIVYWPLAIPYWDDNISFDGNKLNASMKSLTGMLMINIKDLPQGTTAIVLNTHYFAYLDEADKAAGKNELGGSDEALSGTLTTVLKDGAALEVDEDYRHADTLRVDIDKLDKTQDKTIFVPIIAGHYDKLSVLAVSEDSKQAYVWPKAEVLRVFEDLDVKVNSALFVSQTAPIKVSIDNTEKLSQKIAELIANDRKHTIKIINEVAITSSATGKLFIPNNISGQSSVDLTLKEKSTVAFDIVEAEANFNINTAKITIDTEEPWLNIPVSPYDDVTSLNKERTVTITFPDGEAVKHAIILPTSNVIVQSLPSPAIVSGELTILSANTRQVSGYTDHEFGDWKNPRNYKNAGIILRGCYYYVKIHKNQFGHVYAHGNAYDDEILTLEFLGTFNKPTNNSLLGSNIDLRVTDMLIKKILYSNLGDDPTGWIYTTGTTAIKDVEESNPDHKNAINIHACWTGQQLSEPALRGGYDQSKIYTAAQLSSMGLAVKKGYADVSNYNYYTAEILESVWLGGTYFPWLGADVTSKTGGSIEKAFSFNGGNTNFRNMYFTLYEPALPNPCCCDDNDKIAIDEGLGLIRRIDTKETVTIKNVDLTDALMDASKFYIPNIGSICGRVSADGNITLTNNRADDIRVDANGRNIGGAFGWVNTPANVIIEKLVVSENSSIWGVSWVNSKDKNVGGAIGLISGDYDTATKDWNFANSVSATGINVYEEQVTSEDDNVGGQVGYIKTQVLTYGKKISNNTTHMNVKIRTIGSNVGGLIGLAWYKDVDDTKVYGKVEVNEEIYAQYDESRNNIDNSNPSGNNVGGLVGRMFIKAATQNQNKTTYLEGNVRVDGQVVAEARNAGGFNGYYEANNLTTGTEGTGNVVKIVKLLEATEGYVGGLYGYIRTGNKVQIGNTANDADKKGKIAINSIGEIKGALAVGGLIGSNTNGSATAANENQLKVLTEKDVYPISINIKKWTISKTPWYFWTTQGQYYCGTFGTVIGYLNNVINITDANLSVEPQDGVLAIFKRTKTNYWNHPEFTSKNPIFTDDKKLDLLFWMHGVTSATEVEQVITGQGTYFWGDENGYVGYAGNTSAGDGSYILNSVNLKGDTNYNLFYDYSTKITD